MKTKGFKNIAVSHIIFFSEYNQFVHVLREIMNTLASVQKELPLLEGFWYNGLSVIIFIKTYLMKRALGIL
jgi:hypothetical protein